MNSTTNITFEYQKKELDLKYAVCEVLVAIFAVVGNALVIFVFMKERKLRRRTNYYIVSLAAADFLVGLLGIPFAVMSSVGLPNNLYACLFTVSLLVVLCTISIFCLVAVSVDRYWAILHPMGYSRNVRTKTALVIISICWFAGCIVGFLPLMGWHKASSTSEVSCFFLNVMDYNYLIFLYFGTIVTPALILAAFYAHIYQVVLKQLRQIVTMNPDSGPNSGGGTMLRMLGAAQTNEVKATQNLAIIVLFFMICWLPLYTINCIIVFYNDFQVNTNFMLCCIILSHMNSAGNPLLYAYHLRDFRLALKNFFCNLFFKHRICTQPGTRLVNNNYSKSFVSRRGSRSAINLNSFNESKYNHRNRSLSHLATPKISTIAKNSAVVAVATTGDVNREIWNIPEDSGSSSTDSLKGVESFRHDKMLMVRPATPYRPQKVSEINQAYLETSSIESDDVFFEDTLPYHDYIFDDSEQETCLSEKIKRTNIKMKCSSAHKRLVLSSSSPQLSRNLFFVESEVSIPEKNDSKVVRSTSLVDKSLNNDDCNCSPVKNFNLSAFNMGNIFKSSKKSLSRSLSDEGNASMESVKEVRNGGLVRSSCGS